jgi:hypothetical protein
MNPRLKRLDLLLNEVKDPYAQENFWRIKLFLESFLPSIQDAVGNVTKITNIINKGEETVAGTPYFTSNPTLTTPGNNQTLISVVVPAGIVRNLSQVVTICRQESTGDIYSGATLIGSFQTSPATPLACFRWDPNYPVAAGTTIKIDFRARTGSPIVSVDCHLQAIDQTT